MPVLCRGLLIGLFFLAFAPTFAQSPFTTGGTTITISPEDPAPGNEFTARIEAYRYDLPSARVSWRVAGAPRPDLANMREVTLTAPRLGETLEIAVTATEVSGRIHTAETTVSGNTIDLLIEADTYTPYFYAGRTLPTTGSDIRLIALPQIYRPDGTRVAADELVYTWKVDQRVLTQGGNTQTATFTMPRSGPVVVSVTATTRDGLITYTHNEEIRPIEPVMRFYEDNPLYGLSRNTLPNEFTLLSDEITLRAEPYYTSPDIAGNNAATWKIDGRTIENPNTDQQTLTLRKASGEGDAVVEFSVRNLSALRQSALGTFRVYFNQ